MPRYDDEYNRMLMEARRLYMGDLLPEATLRLYLDLLLALDDIVRDVTSGRAWEPRARALSASIRRRLTELGATLAASGDGAAVRAADLAVEAHVYALEAASRAASAHVASSFTTVADEALDMMMVRRGLGQATTFRSLIDRHLTAAAADVDSLLTRGVARGLPARRMAVEIAHRLGAGDPAVQEALRTGRVRVTSGTRRVIADVADDAALRGKGLLRDAYRIAVHETNTAYFEADRVASAASPIVDLVRWELSGRHAGLPSSPDSCDLCAGADAHGYGPGLYHPETVPPLQHPFCQCSTSKVLLRPNAWGLPPRPVPTPRAAAEAEARRLLERAARTGRTGGRARTVTPRHVERQLQQFNDSVRRADAVVRDALLTA